MVGGKIKRTVCGSAYTRSCVFESMCIIFLSRYLSTYLRLVLGWVVTH
jgi:hypothetical protein